jgi:SAM-dependent methyltransferase
MLEIEPDKLVTKVREDYNLIAREWDLSRSRPSQLKLDLIADVEADMLVLDSGCGNGLMLPFFSEKGAFYRGVDFAEQLIAIARKRYAGEIAAGRADFVVGEATQLPFKDEVFDFAISFAVLHHIPSSDMRRQFFAEIKRVLRPGARAKLTVWNLFNEWAHERFDVGAQLAGKTSGDVTVPWKGTRGEIVNRYVHQFSREELEELSADAGFSGISIDTFDRAGHAVANGEELVVELIK